MGLVDGAKDAAVETIATVISAAERGAFTRSGRYDRVDGSPKGSEETVLRFPMDLETAPDTGMLVDFQIFMKDSSHVASHLRKLKSTAVAANTKDLSKTIEAVKKRIEWRASDWGAISEEDKETSLRNMQEFFNAIENDPNATTAGGTELKYPYQKVLDMSVEDMAVYFQGGHGGMRSGQFTTMMKNSQHNALAEARGQETRRQLAQEKEQEVEKTEQTSRLAATEIHETGESIRMYLPGGINFSDQVNYKGVNFGLIKGILEANPGILLPKVLGAAAEFVDQAGEVLGGELNTSEAIEALTGAVSNNRSEQLFEGQEIRTFSFQFAFRPRNADEAREMKRIIEMFRFHMRPELGPASAYYLTPSEFKIRFYTISKGHSNQRSSNEYVNDLGRPTKRKVVATNLPNPDGTQVMLQENNFLPKIKQCALTSLSINTSPDDIMETFADPEHAGTPVSCTLDLTFSEKEEISRQDISLGY
jgi:hypothetical protein